MTVYWSGSNWHSNTVLIDECSLLSACYDQTFVNMDKLRKEQHRIKMVEFRKKEKHKRTEMNRELQRLEHKMNILATRVRNAAAPSSIGASNTVSSIVGELRELVVEQEALRGQNLALRKEIGKYENFQNIMAAAEALMEKEEPVEADTPAYCHPLTRDVFDARMERFALELARDTSSLSTFGSFIGWKVLRAPLVPSSLDSKRILVRSRISKRLHSSFDVQNQMLYTKQNDLGAVILTPGAWSLERTNVSTKVLQEFDQDSIVLMHNIAGPEKTFQYLFQVRHIDWKLEDGRRKMTISMVITNLDTNRQECGAECSEDNANGTTSESFQMTVTEIDKDSVDISCDHFWVNARI